VQAERSRWGVRDHAIGLQRWPAPSVPQAESTEQPVAQTVGHRHTASSWPYRDSTVGMDSVARDAARPI
jgi:hypothetical protein